jgi:hypothetical protein
MPTIKAAPGFLGLGVISTDVYVGGGKGVDGRDMEYYINTVSSTSIYLDSHLNLISTRRIFTDKFETLKLILARQGQSRALLVSTTKFLRQQVSSMSTSKLRRQPAPNREQYVSILTSQDIMRDLIIQSLKMAREDSSVILHLKVEPSEYVSATSRKQIDYLIPDNCAEGGNQQFTAHRLRFKDVQTAIWVMWDWGWVRENTAFIWSLLILNRLGKTYKSTIA